MRNAFFHLSEDSRTALVSEGHPWIRFISFVFHEDDDQLPSALIEFVDDMVNKDDILATVGNREYEMGDIILRLPLPLKGTIGKIVNADEDKQITRVINDLEMIRESTDPSEQSNVVAKVLRGVVLPIEVGFVDSLLIIAREQLDYRYDLSRN